MTHASCVDLNRDKRLHEPDLETREYFPRPVDLVVEPTVGKDDPREVGSNEMKAAIIINQQAGLDLIACLGPILNSSGQY